MTEHANVLQCVPASTWDALDAFEHFFLRLKVREVPHSGEQVCEVVLVIRRQLNGAPVAYLRGLGAQAREASFVFEQAFEDFLPLR